MNMGPVGSDIGSILLDFLVVVTWERFVKEKSSLDNFMVKPSQLRIFPFPGYKIIQMAKILIPLATNTQSL